MSLRAEMKTTTTEGQFGLTSIVPHPTPLNRPSFSSLPHDPHNDALCTIHRHSSANFEAKLGNPRPTCFALK
jgi:hypothetical protein